MASPLRLLTFLASTSRAHQEHDSFHGECDLVLLHSEEFHNGAGLDLHIRTTIQDYFSYIETAALRVFAARPARRHIQGSSFQLCVDDVMTTGDAGLADLW